MWTWLVKTLFQAAGVVEGRDWYVTDENVYRDIVLKGSLGLGEGFVQGKYYTPSLDNFLSLLSASPVITAVITVMGWLSPMEWWRWISLKLGRGRSTDDSAAVGKLHYDLDPALYEKMLGTPMQYSCGYWKGAETLEQAQLAKMELLASKLKLEEGMTILEIGCGWGDLAIHLADKYKVNVVGLTISAEQRRIAMERAEKANVDDRVEFLLEDYRLHKGKYDRIVSVGMLEHVQIANLPTYFACVEKMLLIGGIAVIHSIANRTNGEQGDPWINKYIFPNSAIPSYSAWVSALQHIPLEIEHVQNIGPDYALTLSEWRKRFDELCAPSLDPAFVRMWRFYLTASEVQFRLRTLNLWQMVLTKQRVERYDL